MLIVIIEFQLERQEGVQLTKDYAVEALMVNTLMFCQISNAIQMSQKLLLCLKTGLRLTMHLNPQLIPISAALVESKLLFLSFQSLLQHTTCSEVI